MTFIPKRIVENYIKETSENDTYKFISSEEELNFFWTYGVPPLKPNEIYFVSLSARNKVFDEEQREFFKVGRSEMFAKQQIRKDEYKEFLKHIKRFEVRKDAYLTKSDKPYPAKCLVVYWNICPVDIYKAMKDQVNYLLELQSSLTDSALKNSKAALDDNFYKVRKSFDTCQSLFARNFGTKYWIDFDIDLPDGIYVEDYDKIYKVIEPFGKGNFMFIQTGGGIHCLIKRELIKENPDNICKRILEVVPNAKEVVRNKNEMIPLPGTFQYGQSVIILNKEDFTEKDKLHC